MLDYVTEGSAWFLVTAEERCDISGFPGDPNFVSNICVHGFPRVLVSDYVIDESAWFLVTAD